MFFGGFDGFIEEMVPAFLYLRDAGYEVVAFDGPGQGGALDDAGLPMTAEWHKPVKAVLDYFELNRVALVGLSLGGCLVIRAAAAEPRVERVVAYDILTDFFEVNTHQMMPLQRKELNAQLNLRAAAIVNTMVERAAKKNPMLEWGVHWGMYVTGASSPFEYFRKIKELQTADVSPLVKQDVLLMAGSEDHYVPLEQFYQQIKILSNARSITARLFTRSESGQNHVQTGNLGLAFGTIVNWLNGMQEKST